MRAQPPIIAIRPIRQNWCTATAPETNARSADRDEAAQQCVVGENHVVCPPCNRAPRACRPSAGCRCRSWSEVLHAMPDGSCSFRELCCSSRSSRGPVFRACAYAAAHRPPRPPRRAYCSTQVGAAFDHHAAGQRAMVADRDVGLDNGKRTDREVASKFGLGADEGLWMDIHGGNSPRQVATRLPWRHVPRAWGPRAGIARRSGLAGPSPGRR